MIGRGLRRIKGVKFIYFYIVSGMFVPFSILMMPLVKQTAQIGLANRVGVILLYVVFYMPMNLLLYSGYLKNIPLALEEAARVDGATPLQQFTKITLPVLKPITYLVVTLGIIWSFQVFDLAYLMTGGGPGHSSVTLVMGIYNAAFKQYKMGYACAMAMFLLLMIIIINVVEDLFFKEKKEAK